ncbi:MULTISPECIES: hypothetical protein [unclassified Marinobacter]|uniref:hypothetical protein n=1 Tax=unclassified Marinobacter TaxID=83889 RepID=UPI0026E24E6D|nr:MULTISPECIES: hypothetical protein [unclassified Marinobacter]MDO6442678.1 hypothetical protein [Marinobacter sp. 2_MG-2023]MDO6823105.1 hypothetical protein [Marinobacter sp. 1_MG-2023]
MIVSSQISFLQGSSRQETAFDQSQLRINQQPLSGAPASDQPGGAQVNITRDAAYRYTSQERLSYSGSSTVSGADRSAVFSSAELAEKTAELFLRGQQAISVGRAALAGDSGTQTQGSMSVEANRYMFYSESETRSFASTGSISLENGETIDFTLSLRQSQSRTYEYSESLRIEERPMTDPLVINFGSATAQLNDTLFEFDLNGNGESGQFATLGSGSGYLVFDRNENGEVDDGTELFGPKSGSGFSELATFDDDGNQWIDVSDEVFSSLSVWVQTADGSQDLRSLEDVGVQALYVGSAEDSFTLTNSQGIPLGQIQASGIYLTTDGEVRTLEEITLAEQNTEQVPPAMQSLGGSGGPDRDGNEVGGLLGARIEAIRGALEKLNDIRVKQQAFIEETKNLGEAKSPLDEYMNIINQLRLELLNSQDEKKQAASRYLEFARV